MSDNIHSPKSPFPRSASTRLNSKKCRRCATLAGNLTIGFKPHSPPFLMSVYLNKVLLCLPFDTQNCSGGVHFIVVLIGKMQNVGSKLSVSPHLVVYCSRLHDRF